MKITANGLILLSYLMLTTFCSVTLEDEKQLSITDKFHETEKSAANPKKPRPHRQNKLKGVQRPSLFMAISGLLGGTVIDTFTAYRNVSKLVQTAFAPPKQTTGNATAPVNGTSFTLRQALALLERNYRGLRKLYNDEFTKALNDSYKNALDFRRELKSSARMYLEYDRNNVR